MKKITLFFSCVLLIFVSTTTLVVSRPCQSSQQALLLQFKDTLVFNYTESQYLWQWNKTTDCCTWKGVQCDFAGHIPSRLGNLTNLKYLYLSGSNFTGPIPASLANLTQLERLHLSYNQLSGPIPESIFELSSLKELYLSSNKFSGSVHLDMIGRLGRLTQLDLSYNNLTVNLSTSFAYLPPNLASLRLVSCNITSIIPNVGGGKELTELDLSNNRISGDIPAWVWKLSRLNLSHNSLVGFQRADFISELSAVDLHSNRLEGNIPRQLYYVRRHLDISDNNFNTSIPHNIGDVLGNFVFFSASKNKLTGVIPNSICNSIETYRPVYRASGRILDLSNNSLSGRIPSCLFHSYNYLTDLNLRNNRFSGTIPDRFPPDCRFETLSLSGNLLRVAVPKSLANCQSLEILDIGNNRFQDGFPCWLKNISNLRILYLRSNKFHGDISCIENNSWSALNILDLSSNNFSGELPKKALTHWKAMTIEGNQSALEPLGRTDEYFYGLPPYNYGLRITIKGSEVDLVKILSIFTFIDLSSNNFQGAIPEQIGLLKSLRLLNLSRNSLTGSIPTSIGKMAELESLDLSANNLQGHIPTELASLNFLAVLNLSHNQLVGSIPTSTQLQSFLPSSFEGNDGLCGPPLKDCSNSTNQIPEVDHESPIFDWRMALCIGVGFGTGFVAVVAPLIFSDKVDLWYDIFVHKLISLFRN